MLSYVVGLILENGLLLWRRQRGAKMKKRFKKQSELIKHAVANSPIWTAEEQMCRAVLRLNGIKNPSLEYVQYVIKEQHEETKQRYEELTNV